MIRALIASLLLVAVNREGAAQPVAPLHFQGICDASAAEALTPELVAVADDEDNCLRVYSRRLGGAPLMTRDLSGFLQVNPKSPEADLEGAARIGSRIYWISSHGRDAKGRLSPSRAQFFATTGTVSNGTIDLEPIGNAYHYLLADLFRDLRLTRFELWKTAQLPPKSPGALNIEGLAATTNGQLLIGFRNPLPGGQALVVPLTNPSDLPALKPAQFGEPLLLDLRGLGIRSLTRCRDRFLIVAGRFDEGGNPRLFAWTGGAAPPRPLERVDFLGLNPEAITSFANPQGATELFITSDDGTVQVDGKPCKKLKNPAHRSFRALSLLLPEMPL